MGAGEAGDGMVMGQLASTENSWGDPMSWTLWRQSVTFTILYTLMSIGIVNFGIGLALALIFTPLWGILAGIGALLAVTCLIAYIVIRCRRRGVPPPPRDPREIVRGPYSSNKAYEQERGPNPAPQGQDVPGGPPTYYDWGENKEKPPGYSAR